MSWTSWLQTFVSKILTNHRKQPLVYFVAKRLADCGTVLWAVFPFFQNVRAVRVKSLPFVVLKITDITWWHLVCSLQMSEFCDLWLGKTRSLCCKCLFWTKRYDSPNPVAWLRKKILPARQLTMGVPFYGRLGWGEVGGSETRFVAIKSPKNHCNNQQKTSMKHSKASDEHPQQSNYPGRHSRSGEWTTYEDLVAETKSELDHCGWITCDIIAKWWLNSVFLLYQKALECWSSSGTGSRSFRLLQRGPKALALESDGGRGGRTARRWMSCDLLKLKSTETMFWKPFRITRCI